MDNIIIGQVGVLGVLMLVGVIARKCNMINDDISKGISDILMNIALPAMIIASFEIQFSRELLSKILLILFVSVILHFILIIVSRIAFRRYPKDKQNVLNFFAVFPNAGFMGLPFIQALYGEMAVLYASIFLIPHHILLWTYGQGLFIYENESSERKKINIIQHIKNPAILAVFIGLIVFVSSIKIPYIISRSMSMLGGITSPLAMMIVGDKIAQMSWKDIFSDKDVYHGSLYRLIIAPIITLFIFKLFTTDSLLIHVCVTINTIPAAVAMVILPQKFNGDSSFSSKCVVVSHIISIVTIPVMLLLLL